MIIIGREEIKMKIINYVFKMYHYQLYKWEKCHEVGASLKTVIFYIAVLTPVAIN